MRTTSAATRPTAAASGRASRPPTIAPRRREGTLMPVLVTGGSGVLGRCLITLLLRRGERVRVLDLVPPAPAEGEAAAAVEFVQADMRDLAAVERAAAGCEVIHHLAAA